MTVSPSSEAGTGSWGSLMLRGSWQLLEDSRDSWTGVPWLSWPGVVWDSWTGMPWSLEGKEDSWTGVPSWWPDDLTAWPGES